MANTYNWVVNSLDCVPSTEGKNNIVSCVHWSVIATSSESKTTTNIDGSTSTTPYSASIYGAQPLIYKSENSFIDYSKLTKDTVIGWVQEAMGVDQVMNIQVSLDSQLKDLINPPTITPPLPWGN